MSGLPLGSVAPDFALRDQHGQTRALSDLHGRCPAALVFYPAVFSSVCGSELLALHEWWSARPEPPQTPEVALWAISCDPMFALRGYADAEGIDFPLLSDFWPHGAVAQAYGAFDETTGTAGRSTYVVDAQGRIAWSVHHPARQARAVADLQQALDSLTT